MDAKLKAKILAALDAGDLMFSEFMEPTTSIAGQIDIYKAAHKKVKAARKALSDA